MAEDAFKLFQANQQLEPLEHICRYRFKEALAPNLAAKLQGIQLSIEELFKTCTTNLQQDAFLIVEGAGGFFSPLTDAGKNSDLAVRLQLPVLIVVDDRLGAINQALLTHHAVVQQNLKVQAIVLNSNTPSGFLESNQAQIAQYVDCPVYRCGYNDKLETIELTDTV